jgi:hypothetical protein
VAALAGLATLAAVFLDLTPLLRGPAPYPPEWRWELRGGPTSGRLLPALVSGAGLVALLALLAGQASRLRARLALAASVALGFGLQLGLLALEPEGALRTLVQRTLSRTVTSYYSVALSPMAEDARDFLARHDELLPAMRHGAKHASTHPPGPVLYYRGLLALLESRPGLAQATLDAAGLADPGRRPAARAAALLGPLLLLLACAATAWPVAALARRTGADEATAARAGVLWALLPGPALMAPQLDQALALPVAGSAAALAAAVAAVQPRRRTLWAVAAGLCAAVAAFISYGAIAFVAVTGAATLAAVVSDRARIRSAARALVLAAAGALTVVALTVALGHRPWRSAAVALAIHRADFTAPRSYSLWLLFNPLDLALFLGVPVAVLFLFALARALRAGEGGPGPLERFTLATATGIAVLVVSGTVRGEVGRIWIPLMPALLVAAEPRARSRWGAPLLGALLLALCVVLRLRWQVG